MTQKRKYEVITERENWTLPFFKASSGFCPFFSPSIFESGAALAHGLDLCEERKYRILIIQYMFECGEALLLPYNTICIAIIYFHKFFASISIRAHDPYFISTSCLYTAGKQEETRIRLDRCARFLFEYKQKIEFKDNHDTRNINPYPTKHELGRICKKLSIAELLCTQINKFYYSINLAFDYLLPIISQWKSVYIPHQTNIETLKDVYTLHAFKFIKQSFYIPINLIIAPQKIAIVCMELSLRLNYEKYRLQQEELTKNDTEIKYRYIDPPIEWFRIFDVNENEQDLKDEIHLLCNEIINAVQDVHEFGCEKDIERCKMWRKNTLKMDSVHKEIIEQQLAHEEKLKKNENDDDAQYVLFNMCKELEAKELLSSSSSSIHRVKTYKVMKHRYEIHNLAETSLAQNNEAISPATLQPHKYLNLYPLKTQCFEDVDKEYNEMKAREKEKEKVEDHKRINRTKSKDKKKKRYHNNKAHEASSSSSSCSEHEGSDTEMQHYDDETEEERKSNAVKTKIRTTKKRKSKKRKRSESSQNDKDVEKKENDRKRRRIERDKSSKYNKANHDETEISSDASLSYKNHRSSRKDRKSRKRSSSCSSSSRHKEKEKERKKHRKKRGSVTPLNNDKKKSKKVNNNNNNNNNKREQNRYNKNKRTKSRNKKKNHLTHYNYEHGYYKEMNACAFPYYDDRNMKHGMFEDTANLNFDYGLTPKNKKEKIKLKNEVDEHESGECTDDQLRMLLNNRSNRSHHGRNKKRNNIEFNEEKTQRNEQEPISPLLKALKGNDKSKIYTNMFVPSRKDK